MSAPIIWILLPFLASVGLWFLQRRTAWVTLLATFLSLFLAGLALLLPIDVTIRVGSLAIRIEPVWVVAGRQLVLSGLDRPLLTFFYAMAAFWFAGGPSAAGHRSFIPFGLGIITLLVGALAIQPVLYAALFLEGAVLLSLPILVPPGHAPTQGVLRYLIFQSLAMPLFILGSWALTGVQANPADTNLVALTAIFLGLAFAFWLAVFPFYTWAPLLAGQAHPYAAGFIFLVFPIASLFLGLEILVGSPVLRSNPVIWEVLRLSGGVMVVTAGIWAAFQRELGRLFGYAAIVQTGFCILALSLGNRLGNEIFIMLFLARVIALGLWGLASAVLQRWAPSLKFSDLERIAERLPVASAAIAIAVLSIAGLPLLAEFPLRSVLLQEISTQHPIAALGVLLGSIGLLFSGFRFLAVITGGNLGLRQLSGQGLGETLTQVVLLGGGILGLLLLGIAPRFFYPGMVGLLGVFGPIP